jgi:hypothetical protein
MAQPDYVPSVLDDRVRPSSRLSTPGHWVQDRPAELLSLRPPSGAGYGTTGPDLGFGLKLAKRVAERAVLAQGEHSADAIAGCFASGARRASVSHRAPVVHDMEWAFTLWGFFPGAPSDLVAHRQHIFAGAARDYDRQRAIAGVVQEDALRLSPRDMKAGLGEWRKWLAVPAPGS